MTVKNKYANRSKISEGKFRQIVKLFSIDLNASQIAKISGLNRNTINRYLIGIRKRIAEFCERQNIHFLEKLKLMKASLALVTSKVKGVVTLSEKQLYSASSNAMGASSMKLSLIVEESRCKRLFEAV